MVLKKEIFLERENKTVAKKDNKKIIRIIEASNIVGGFLFRYFDKFWSKNLFFQSPLLKFVYRKCFGKFKTFEKFLFIVFLFRTLLPISFIF